MTIHTKNVVPQQLMVCLIGFLVLMMSAQPCVAFQFALKINTEVSADSIISTVKRVPTGSTVGVEFVGKPRWSDMFVNIPRDWVRWSQVSFQSDKIGMWFAVVGSTALLIATDDASYRVSRRFYESGSFNASASEFFSNMGDGRTQFALSAAFAFYGWVADDAKALRVASQIFETVLASGIVVQVLKHSTGRESPIVATSPTGTWRFFPNPIKYHERIPAYDAYPSGHVTTSLATVTVLAENYPEAKWIRPIGYTLVGALGVGMVNWGIHWYSDYPLALALGYYFGMLAAHPEGFDLGDRQAYGGVTVSVIPTLQSKGGGFSLRISF